MKMNEFQLERLFARFGPRAKHILSATSCESCSMKEILKMADSECKGLWDNLDMGYTNYRGHVKLREAIVAQRYKRCKASRMNSSCATACWGWNP